MLDAIIGRVVCGGCGRLRPGAPLRQCPACGVRVCAGCLPWAAAPDHRLEFRDELGPPVEVEVWRCRVDGAPLRRRPPEPYVEALRRVEILPWDRAWWEGDGSPGRPVAGDAPALILARRYLAIGQAFLPGSEVALGVFGASLRFLAFRTGAGHLAACARVFGPERFPLAVAARLTRAFIRCAALRPVDGPPEPAAALRIAWLVTRRAVAGGGPALTRDGTA